MEMALGLDWANLDKAWMVEKLGRFGGISEKFVWSKIRSRDIKPQAAVSYAANEHI